MDLRRPTPTVLASQASYSPPAPPRHHHPSSHLSNNNNNSSSNGQSLAAEYAAAAAVAGEAAASLASFDGSAGYHGGKIEAAGVSVSRQPLQESTGNAQQHPHHHHSHQAQNSHHHHQYQHHSHHHHQGAASHYPPGQYPLPSLPSTRSCTPALASLGGPLAPPPAPVPTPPILGSNVPQHPHHAGSAAAAAAAAAAGAVPSSSLRLRRYHLDMMRKRNQNPIYDCPEFAQYRLKQKDKDCKVWPDVLEHAFLDG